jgi:hypothetical protein
MPLSVAAESSVGEFVSRSGPIGKMVFGSANAA